MARWASIGSGRERAFVAGDDIPSFDEQTVGVNPLTVWQLDGGDVGKPSGTFTFAFPKIAVDGDERLHLVWVEPIAKPASRAAAEWAMMQPGSIWAANFTAPAGWSVPERLYSGPVNWHKSTIPDLILDADGHMLLLAATGLGVEESALIVGRFGQRWSVTSSSAPSPAYLSVASKGNRIFLGQIAADASAPGRDLNSVFVQRSDDGGRTWHMRSLVSRSGTHPARQVKILAGATGGLHLIWIQELSNGGRAIRIVHSNDDGSSWSMPEDIALSARITNLQAAIDRCDRTHVIYEDWRNGPDEPFIAHAVWKSHWSDPVRLLNGTIAADPTLSVLPDGRLVLVFLALPHNSSTPVMSLYTEQRPL